MRQKNDIIEHLFKKEIIDAQMREDIYRYYDFLDLTERLHKNTPDIIYV